MPAWLGSCQLGLAHVSLAWLMPFGFAHVIWLGSCHLGSVQLLIEHHGIAWIDLSVLSLVVLDQDQVNSAQIRSQK
jgi:hypothetical protein